MVPFLLNGPSIVEQGVPSIFIITPSTVTSDTVTFSDGSGGGTFSPSSILLWDNSALSMEVEYTAAKPGSIVITAISTDGSTVTNSPLSINSYAVAVDAIATKCGKSIAFITNSTHIISNGNPVPAVVTAVNSVPTVNVNNNQIQIDSSMPIWLPTTLDSPFVMYRLQCGSVQDIHLENAGTSSYLDPSASWNDDGGGTLLIPGKPITASGIIQYTIVNPGSNYSGSFSIVVPGGTFTQQASAYVTVVNGSVSSVTPLTGSSLSYGIGYSGTLTNVTLNGGGGTGLIVNCTIGNYIQSIPVISSSNDFTGLPTLTITDNGSGGGAIAVAVMSGPSNTDVITYSANAGWLTTKIMSTTFKTVIASNLAVAPATNASVLNSVGQFESPTGRTLGFNGKPSTLFAGGNVSGDTLYEFNICFMGKNKLKASMPWTASTQTNVYLDSNYYPLAWTPFGTITAQFYGFGGPRGTTAMTNQYQGNWSIQYDDDYYDQGSSVSSMCIYKFSCWSQCCSC